MSIQKQLAAAACEFMAWLPFPIHFDELPGPALFLRRWVRPSLKALTRQDWRDLATVLSGGAIPEERRAALKEKVR